MPVRLLPDEAMIRCWPDAASSAFLLAHSVTEQRVWLPPGDPQLQADGEGFCSVVIENERLYVDEEGLLEAKFVQDEAGNSVVLFKGAATTLKRWKENHELCEYSFPLSPGRIEQTDVYFFQHSWGGSHFYWSLPSLHRASGALKGTASTWYLKYFDRWAKQIENVGWDSAIHLRRAARTRQSNGRDDAINPEIRCCKEANLSTFALFTLLPRWSSENWNKGGKRNTAASEEWRRLLYAVCEENLAGEEDFRFYHGRNVMSIPGIPVQGSRFVLLHRTGCVIDIRPLTQLRGQRTVPQNVQAYASDCDEVHVADLLTMLSDAGKAGLCALGQVACQVGLAVESAMFDKKATATKMEDEGVGAATVRQELGNFAKRVTFARQTERNQRRGCAAYWLASQIKFQGANVVHLAVDAVRAGCRGLFVAFATLPSNAAAWAPPTVPDILSS